MNKYRVENADAVARWPEADMGIHFGQAQGDNDVYMIIGTEIAIKLSEIFGMPPEPEPLPDWHTKPFSRWLPAKSKTFTQVTVGAVLGYVVTPVGPLPPPPAPPATVYGHLPFTSRTTGFDRFYRWEPWPTSRKFDDDPTDGPIIVGETFASPESELPLIPSGFAAVARNALPSLYPATSRYLIEPEPDQLFYCGPSVPLFGMSGGGVEVKFLPRTKLRRMPLKTVIDAL